MRRQNTLIPIDGSPDSLRALTHAREWSCDSAHAHLLGSGASREIAAMSMSRLGDSSLHDSG